MLLFISQDCLFLCGNLDFKTSYVTVYPSEDTSPHYQQSISKHRMLLFICQERQPVQLCQHFKTSYVTVYLLRMMFLAILMTDFKTSYVTVYQTRPTEDHILIRFQNIVCYCLSSDNASFMVLPSLFQNIVCYCLSKINRHFMDLEDIFQNIVCYCLSKKCDDINQ